MLNYQRVYPQDLGDRKSEGVPWAACDAISMRFRTNFCRDGKEWPLTKTHSLGNYIGFLLVISHSFSFGKCHIYQRFSYYELFYFFHGRLWHDCRRPTRMPRWQHCNAEPENSWLSSFWDCEFAQHYATHNYDPSKTIFTGAFHTLWNVNYMYIMYNTLW